MNQPELQIPAMLERSVKRVMNHYKTDAAFRAMAPSPQALAELGQSCQTSIAMLAKACQLYAERPAIGFRSSETVRDLESGLNTLHPLAAFTTVSYGELWQMVTRLAGGLSSVLNIGPKVRVGICGPSTLDFMTVDFAALYLGATSVPLQSNVSSADFTLILDDAAIDCLVVSIDALAELVPQLSTLSPLRKIVVMDLSAQDELKWSLFARLSATIRATAPQMQIAVLSELIQKESAAPAMYSPAAGEDQLVSIMYTSGSTGSPKGALFYETIWFAYWQSCLAGLALPTPYTWVNFMPFNHVMGRLGVIRSLIVGGTTYLTYKSDMSTLIEDIQLVRPTNLTLVPRVAIMIYQHYQLTLAKWQRDGVSNAEEALIAEMRGSYLGDRLVFGSNGSAPLSSEISQFLMKCFDIPLFDGYGSTEAGIVTFNHQIRRENVIDYKLVDVPELSYRTSDKPYPRGELRVKCRQAVPGYLNNPDASQALFDENGYIKTGDIVEERGTDIVVWVDRIKNVLKLAQGEFVNTWQLESVFGGGSAAIDQIYLYGNSLRSYLLAVVVPSAEVKQSYLGEAGAGMQALKQFMQSEIRRIGTNSQLRAFEVPRDFIIETTPFSKEEGLLTESNKMAHMRLKAKYEERLGALYEQIEQGQIVDLAAFASASAKEMVLKALQTILGTKVTDCDHRFSDLGGDSMDSVRFSDMIEQISGITVPVSLILSPTSTIRHLIDYLEERKNAPVASDALTFAKVHGIKPAMVQASDLAVDKIFTASELAAVRELTPPVPGTKSKTVLLTGANGFLGRFLALTLLERLPEDGRLYCMVRAASHEAAYRRLLEGFLADNGSGKELANQLKNDKRLVVLAGDLVKDQLGLDDETYEQLAQQVDTIVHNGALVNHAFTYQQLFEPNVLGSIAVMRLAITKRIKSISFISSVSVPAGLPREGMVMEQEDVRTMWPVRPLVQGYAVGYATSKWAVEVLLRNLTDFCGVPANTFRCGMILAHSQKSGQINAADFFTRLLLGLTYTGIAPESFYEASVKPAGTHFGGLPVDFIAAAISSIATKATDHYANYHVVNPHWDEPVSLDLVTDWMRSFGYQIKAIEDHADWYQEFKQRLSALDEVKRGHSPLPIVYQWEKPLGANGEMQLSTSLFVETVQAMARQEGTSPLVPNLTEAYIHKCMRDVCQLGLTDAPAEPAYLRRRRDGYAAEQGFVTQAEFKP